MLKNTEIKEHWIEYYPDDQRWSKYFRYYHWIVPKYYYVNKGGNRQTAGGETRCLRRAKEGYEYLNNNHGTIGEIERMAV